MALTFGLRIKKGAVCSIIAGHPDVPNEGFHKLPPQHTPKVTGGGEGGRPHFFEGFSIADHAQCPLRACQRALLQENYLILGRPAANTPSPERPKILIENARGRPRTCAATCTRARGPKLPPLSGPRAPRRSTRIAWPTPTNLLRFERRGGVGEDEKSRQRPRY